MKRNVIISFFCSLLLTSCSTVPSFRIPQPWTRSLKSSQVIDPTKSIKIEAIGTTTPLLGDEQLVSNNLRTSLIHLIERRGFKINSETYDYLVKMLYKTDKHDTMRMSSSVYSKNTQISAFSTGSGVGVTSGLGVSIARTVGAMVSNSKTAATQTVEQITSYTHTIAVEFFNKKGDMLWKGESTWESAELDLTNQIIYPLQLILSDLPADKNFRPQIPEVKYTHIVNYYRLNCKGIWFTCPALPYRILFINPDRNNSINGSPSAVKNPIAFSAYLDLIQTAEYALPKVKGSNWRDPLEPSLWRNVTLGGQYSLGPDKTPINVIIRLAGHPDGYYIEECKIVNNKEYADFEDNLMIWRNILNDYYDVFKR
ncbi:MAG: hypothetical protein ABII64_01120 [Elusimicrobiota bacterium]